MAQLSRNISYLTLSQAAHYLFPLITIPYITRVVGPEYYGIIEFVTVVMVYLAVVVDYSFATTATREIAAHAEDEEAVSSWFSAVMAARFFLFLVVLVLFSLGLLLFPQMRAQALALSLALPLVMAWAVFPDFLLLGVQKTGILALANLLTKAVGAALLFTFIQQPMQYLWVPFISGMMQFAASLISLWYVLRYVKNCRWRRPAWKAVQGVIYEGRLVFFSNFFTRIYGFSGILLGGFLLEPALLGVYAAGAKLITVGQSFLFQPLRGALFPYLSVKLKQGHVAFDHYHRRATLLMIALTLMASLVTYWGAPYLVALLFGDKYEATVGLLRIMAPVFVIGSVAHMALNQGLLLLRNDRLYMFWIIIVGVFSLVLHYFAIREFSISGAAWAKVSVELILAAGAFWFFRRQFKLYAASR